MDDVDGTIETAHRGSFCPPSNCRGGQEHSSIPLSRMERAALIDRAFRLEYATIVWMMIEGAVAIWSGARAHSVSQVAFGIDSLIEIASAMVLIWRLTTELRQGQRLAEQAERRAGQLAGALLSALTIYVVTTAAFKLAAHNGEVFSLSGLVVTLLAMPIMYLLARRKIALAEALGSQAMRADAVASITCSYLSFVVVVRLVVEALTGAWWVDVVTSFGIVGFLIREGSEAWSGKCCS